jgi:hypothetical protein
MEHHGEGRPYKDVENHYRKLLSKAETGEEHANILHAYETAIRGTK